jgi:hypothetical protein
MIEAQTLISATNGFSFVQGEFAITIVSDGFITVPIDIVAPEGSAEERAHILRSTGNIKAGLVESKTNIPVIRKGRDLIMVDIGSGDKYQPSDGRLSENLKAAGISPSAITKGRVHPRASRSRLGNASPRQHPEIPERDLLCRGRRMGFLDEPGLPDQHANRTP